MEIVQAVVTFMSRFATQLLEAMLMFAPVLNRRSLFPLRITLYVSLYSFFPYLLMLLDPGSRIYHFEWLEFGWFNLNWMAVFLACMAGFFFCFKVSLTDLLFFGTAAYAMQHLARNAATLTNAVFGLKGFWAYFDIFVVGVALYVLAYFVFVRRIKKGDELGINNKYILALSVVTILIVYLLSVYVSREERTEYSGKIYAIVCCLLLLILQFGLFERGKDKRERAEIEKMMHGKQAIREINKENIDIINRKCHDLRHQIAAIRAMTCNEAIEKELKDVENAVLIYDSIAKTGNDALDTIITEKSLYCEKHNIKLTYLADVSGLGVMSDVDLYSLFGNAIENAIESVIDIPDPDKRVISMSIGRRGDLISIHIDNYVERPPVFEHGLPVTTKADKQYHGYGLKSIQYIAEKYGGHISVRVEDNVFELDIVIPAGT